MRPKHLVSIVLIAVVLVMLMRNNNSMTNARPLVYRESLDEVAAQINDETLTLRDMAFYVGYEEYQIQQEALVYDPDDPNRYWSMRVEGGFMNAVARKNAMQMALHERKENHPPSPSAYSATPVPLRKQFPFLWFLLFLYHFRI